MSKKQQEAILGKLTLGESLTEICTAEDMPNRCTVQRWQAADEEFDAAVTHAREVGYEARADKAVKEAKTATDASLGRLAFDAERWYLGKLSNAFSDNKVRKQEITHGLDPEVSEWLGMKS